MRNESEILNLYVSEDSLRKELLQPFEQNNMVYASDGCMLIAVSKSEIEYNYREQSIPKCKDLFDMYDPQESLVKLNDLEKLLSDVDLIPEVIVTENRTICDECGGEGVVYWEYGTFTRESDCPYCEGEGYTTDEVLEKTGNMIRDPKSLVKLHNRSFKLKHIERIIKTMELTGVYTIIMKVCKIRPYTPVVFYFNSSINVLAMPIFKMD